MTEFATAQDGVRLAYDVVGKGPAVLLIHGFGSSRRQNWKDPRWYDTLERAGYCVVAMDCRGHGDSDKPHDPSFYGHDRMAQDAIAVLDAVGASSVRLMGYSMGGFISFHLLLGQSARIAALAVGGVGATYFSAEPGSGDRMTDPDVRERIAEALLVADKDTITDPTARTFRFFADQGGKDRVALAACMRAFRRNFTPGELAQSAQPVLVVCGENDVLTGPSGPLAAAFVDGRAVTVPNRDHMTTVGDRVYKQAVLRFFAEH